MDLEHAGRLLFLLGGLLLIVGVFFLVISRIPGLNRFGSLPGDIHLESGNFACFAPIVSMLILSILLTIVLNIIIRIVDR